MDIKLDDKSVQAFVVKSLIESLSKEKVQELFSAGLYSLIKSDYELKRGLDALILQEMREYINSNETFREQMRSMATEAVNKMLESEKTREDVINHLASAMGAALVGKARF